MNINLYSKEQIDIKLHKLTSSEISAEAARIKVADIATNYCLYHVSFKEITLGKLFQFTFTPENPDTFAVVYYDGTHAIHMTTTGNNYYFTIYDLAAGQDLASISVNNLVGCRIMSS